MNSPLNKRYLNETGPVNFGPGSQHLRLSSDHSADQLSMGTAK